MASRLRHQGFALLGVLWVIITLGLVATEVARITNRAVRAGENERNRVTGRWLAEGCLARFRAVADEVLGDDPARAAEKWRMLDSVALRDSATAFGDCDLTMTVSGRPVFGRATAAELDSLPGMTSEAVARILELRSTGAQLTSLAPVASLLSPSARKIFFAAFEALSRRLVLEPDAWVVRSRGHIGLPPTPVNVEALFVRAGTRAALARRQEW